jgi:DNA-binding GntR family transcriptional regulator
MMVKEHPILTTRRETMVDRLVQLLQESIFSGKLAPETRVSEVSIAKEFDVSRVPAREALQRLEEMNLVRKTYRGREIMKFSREEFRHISELKIVVDAFGVMQGSLNANLQDFEKIEAILKQMEEGISQGDLNRRLGLDHTFHDSLVICSRNPMLINTFLSLAKQVRWALPYALRFPLNPEEQYRRHREIFELFRQREAEKVRRLIEAHSNEALTRVLAQMEIKDQG